MKGRESVSIPTPQNDDILLYKKLIIFTKPHMLSIGTALGSALLLFELPYLLD